MSIVNIAAYKFVSLERLLKWQGELRDQCLRLDLKGTILLGEEGINLMLAGTEDNISQMKVYLTAFNEFSDLKFKESLSEELPFTHLKVKIKAEIVTMGVDDIDPLDDSVPHLAPEEFKLWLDEGRDIAVLDTRNGYEFEYGTFANAIDPKIDNFREFPDAIKAMKNELQDKPVVIFCTGGIRCEKAGPAMRKQGFKNVYQLDGGILNYFERCGGAHYEGTCFVFDDRVAVDSSLQQAN